MSRCQRILLGRGDIRGRHLGRHGNGHTVEVNSSVLAVIVAADGSRRRLAPFTACGGLRATFGVTTNEGQNLLGQKYDSMRIPATGGVQKVRSNTDALKKFAVRVVLVLTQRDSAWRAGVEHAYGGGAYVVRSVAALDRPRPTVLTTRRARDGARSGEERKSGEESEYETHIERVRI